MAKLIEMVRAAEDIAAIERFLDGLPHGDRRAEVEALNGADLAKLYALADGRQIEADFFVPADQAVGAEVVHHGKNSLPVIGGTFRKRFARIAGDEELIGGFNDNDGFVSQVGWFTGPGYFVVRPRGCSNPDGRTDTEQLFVNYYEVPQADAALVRGWPDVAGNTGLTSGIVFGEMCDYMWRVSAHTSIGQAWKKGKNMGQHFALVREDVAK
jgi:hypothetical protein